MSEWTPGQDPNQSHPQPGYLAPQQAAPFGYAPPVPRRDPTVGLLAGVIAAIVLATGGGIGIGWNLSRLITSHATSSAQIHTVAPVSPSPNASTGQSAVAKVIPAVVDINTVIQTSNATSQAAGTGLILTSNGDVLTNNHVVQGAITIKVSIQGRSGTYSAEVVGVDPAADIAVIHVQNVSGLPTVQMADSSKLHIGETVYAIGNALGVGGTPKSTKGQITALDQTITASENGANSETLTGMIQADAEISPGDSGGALINAAGQVIGMITAGQASSFRTTTSSVGFAIPANTAVDIANRILKGEAGNGIFIGPVGFLGVSIQTLDATQAAQLGLSITSGALVGSVQPGSPAESAGITPGSVITRVNTSVIDTSQSLGDALHQFKPGDQVKITWVAQGGTTRSATVTLIAGPAI